MKLKPQEKSLKIKGVWLMRDPEYQRAKEKMPGAERELEMDLD